MDKSAIGFQIFHFVLLSYFAIIHFVTAREHKEDSRPRDN